MFMIPFAGEEGKDGITNNVGQSTSVRIKGYNSYHCKIQHQDFHDSAIRGVRLFIKTVVRSRKKSMIDHACGRDSKDIKAKAAPILYYTAQHK